MATYNNDRPQRQRRIFIARENGQQDKDGKPYWFEWLPQMPETNDPRRKFEMRRKSDGSQNVYEMYKAVDGYLVGIDIHVKSFNGTEQTEQFLVLLMTDGGDEYLLEIGQIDGRYSMDVMKRLLDPAFNPNLKLRLAPYSITENEKKNIGLAAISGVDQKLSAKRDSSHLIGIPEPEVAALKGKTYWDFTPVSGWLYSMIQRDVVPKLRKDPIAVPAIPLPAPTSNAVQVEVPAVDFDDLPF